MTTETAPAPDPDHENGLGRDLRLVILLGFGTIIGLASAILAHVV